MLPAYFWLMVVVVFGLIIGSFLNVVIYRLHTGRSLNDRSHCLSCGRQLEWYELFPVVSYLALRGRCRTCRSFIPYRYALVEILTAMAFVVSYLQTVDVIHFLLSASLLSVLIVGLAYDFYHMIIPDEVSYGAASLAIAIVLWDFLTTGDLSGLASALIGTAVAFLVYASLWYFSKGRAFGFGDAKLAVSLGMLAGTSGVFSLIVLSFWIGALVSVFLILWQRTVLNIGGIGAMSGRVTIKSEVPFAPFLIAAFVLVHFFHVDVLVFIEALYEIVYL
jgi:leader peptidase (prepilin peptidase)/N-methyltransferase